MRLVLVQVLVKSSCLPEALYWHMYSVLRTAAESRAQVMWQLLVQHRLAVGEGPTPGHDPRRKEPWKLWTVPAYSGFQRVPMAALVPAWLRLQWRSLRTAVGDQGRCLMARAFRLAIGGGRCPVTAAGYACAG